MHVLKPSQREIDPKPATKTGKATEKAVVPKMETPRESKPPAAKRQKKEVKGKSPAKETASAAMESVVLKPYKTGDSELSLPSSVTRAPCLFKCLGLGLGLGCVLLP